VSLIGIIGAWWESGVAAKFRPFPEDFREGDLDFMAVINIVTGWTGLTPHHASLIRASQSYAPSTRATGL
jgi:uncharacterized membrane protein